MVLISAPTAELFGTHSCSPSLFLSSHFSTSDGDPNRSREEDFPDFPGDECGPQIVAYVHNFPDPFPPRPLHFIPSQKKALSGVGVGVMSNQLIKTVQMTQCPMGHRSSIHFSAHPFSLRCFSPFFLIHYNHLLVYFVHTLKHVGS